MYGRIPLVVAEKRHASLAPSSAHRWTQCHASIEMCTGRPYRTNKYATEGSVAHEVADLTLRSAHGRARNLVGARIHMAGEDHEVTKVMADFVQVYVDYVLGLGGFMYPEQSLPLAHITGEFWEDEKGDLQEATGTTDAVVISEDGDELIVVDLKYGTGVQVGPTENKQLIMYASAALRAFEFICQPTWVRLVICQPRVRVKPSEWTVTTAELLEREAEIRAEAQIIRAPGPKRFVPSRSNCRFCDGKVDCDAYKEMFGEDTYTPGAQYQSPTVTFEPISSEEE